VNTVGKMQFIEKLFSWIVNFFAGIAGILLVAIMLATVFKVGLRGMAGIGVIGIDQLSGMAMVYMTFLGAVWVLRNNGHVTVDLLISAVSAPTRRRLVILNSIIGAGVCFTLSFYGFSAVYTTMMRGTMVVQELEMPRAVGLVPIPVGSLLLGVEFLRRVLVAHRGGFDAELELRPEA